LGQTRGFSLSAGRRSASTPVAVRRRL
jgi:hypothetical protein